MPVLRVVLRLISFPIWLLSAVLKLLIRPFRIRSASARTVRNVAGEEIGQTSVTADPDTAADETLILTEIVKPHKHGAYFGFKRIQIPESHHEEDPDFDFEVAIREAAHARRFFAHDFSLFPPGNLFYEEVEAEYLVRALGVEKESEDAEFVDTIVDFRKTINDNTRAMLVCIIPLVLAALMAVAIYIFKQGTFDKLIGTAEYGEFWVAGTLTLAALLLVAFLYFSVFNLTLTKNLADIKMYIMDQSAYIHKNYQAAIKKGLVFFEAEDWNHRDEVGEFAGTWILATEWLALRLYLRDLFKRNIFYQIRRNTKLYSLLGTIICLLIIVAANLYIAFSETLKAEINAEEWLPYIALGGSGLAFIVIIFAWMGSGIYSNISNDLKRNKWIRFPVADLGTALSDQVAVPLIRMISLRDMNKPDVDRRRSKRPQLDNED